MRKYSEDDEIYLEYYLYDEETKTYDDAAEFLGRSNNQLIKKAHKMRRENENVGYVRKPFEDWEIEYLKKSYKKVPVAKIAEYLSRSEDTVINKANSLGIKKLTLLKDYDKDIRYLASKNYTRASIARILGLNYRSVMDYIQRNKITCRYAQREEMGSYWRRLEHTRIEEARNRRI
ncbi:hypothetical protein [Enterococcus faecalis]|uniref:hypothetical protein n=1 Tax=Enterococcus faecalis TaxID=1351 RepID=UPI002AA2437B|nr:hypothetical protein [Enterococcus faecalis]HEL7543370.1 hypothetical protein [Enterococcus faecalis]HEL7551485.1 hypothetical protein [Enterococcus faecalis]